MRADWLTRRLPALTALVALAIVGAAVAGYFGARVSLRDDDERTFTARAASVATRIDDFAGDVIATAASTAHAVELGESRPAFDAVRDVPVLTGPLTRVPGVRRVRVVGADALADGGPLAVAAAEARDRGEPRLTAGTSSHPELAVALYTDGPEPRTVEDRRARAHGALAVTLDLPTLLQRATSGRGAFPVDVDVRDGGVLVATTGGHAQHAPQVTNVIDLAGAAWQVDVRPARAFAHGARLPLVILIGGILLAALAFAAAYGVSHAARRSSAAAAGRARELELIGDAGTLLQQSLDVADIVPPFALQLVDEFALDRVALLVSDDDGRLRELFVAGSTGGRRAIDALPMNPAHARPGEEFLVALNRSGRRIGALRVRPREAVDSGRMQVLSALADLLAAALGNIQLYADEQETVRRLQEVDRLKNDFVSTVSHELRTTVTAIAGFADLLEQQWDQLTDESRRDFVRRVTRNAGSLRLLVDDMLDFTRLDRVALTVEPEPVDLSALVRSVADDVSSLLERHTIVLDVDDGVQAFVDRRAVDRILTNLLSNAAKYAPSGTRVTVSLSGDGGSAMLVVADEGPGIPAADRERVFARFYRGDTESARRTRGTGVGLAVVQELVDRLGGTVVLDDAPGGGARFTLTFPVEPPTRSPIALVDTSQGERHESSS